MNPAVIIPTYWSQGDRYGTPGGTVCYDHATPIDSENPELAECLSTLSTVVGLGTVVVLVVAPPEVEEQAVHRVHQIAEEKGISDVVVVDSFKAYAIVDMFQDELPADIGEPIGLRGYGAIRNMGLVAALALGCDVAVFLDDDEVLLDKDFLVDAIYGLGVQPRSGLPIVAKSGYFLDRRNSALADRRKAKSYNRHWAKRTEFNQWMTQALAGPRISRSNTLCGGCFAVHAEAFTRVAFDPWITRGEDMDYLFNLHLYGIDVWFDNRWRVRHMPPRVKDTASRFLQDVYRWTYERRKLEVCNTNIDLHKVQADTFMPYPGPWISAELPTRIRKTAFLRALLSSEKGAYWKVYRHGRKDAVTYAEENCGNYLRFQACWAAISAKSWRNDAMAHLLHGEGMMNANVAARMAERSGFESLVPGDESFPPAPQPDFPASSDPYGEPSPYGASDPYGAADPYGASDPYAASNQYGASDQYGAPAPTGYATSPAATGSYRFDGPDDLVVTERDGR